MIFKALTDKLTPNLKQIYGGFGMPKRIVSDEEKALWLKATENMGVPLVARPSSPQTSHTPKKGRELDRRTQEKLERGEMEIEAVLDLHGQTLAQGHKALEAFIKKAFARGARCLLVITGKGREGAGLIKKSLPEWLAAPAIRDFVLQVREARPKDGGSGAFYIYLRKAKNLPD